MTTRTSWRVRLPDLAALLDDPRVQAVLIEPQGPADVRDAAGERLDLWLPPLALPLLRALARSPAALDDDGFVFSALETAAGPALHVRRRPGPDQLGLPPALDDLLARCAGLGASILVTAPTVAARVLGSAMVARVVARSRRLLVLPEARELDAVVVQRTVLDGLALDHVALLAGELSGDALPVLRGSLPCVATVAGLDLEAGVARLVAQLATERPGLGQATLTAWVTRRFDLVLELDAHRVVSLAELHPSSEGGVAVLRLVRRGADGSFDVELAGSRIEHLLGGDAPRPKLSMLGVAPTAVARPPRRAPSAPVGEGRGADDGRSALVVEPRRGSEVQPRPGLDLPSRQGSAVQARPASEVQARRSSPSRPGSEPGARPPSGIQPRTGSEVSQRGDLLRAFDRQRSDAARTAELPRSTESSRVADGARLAEPTRPPDSGRTSEILRPSDTGRGPVIVRAGQRTYPVRRSEPPPPPSERPRPSAGSGIVTPSSSRLTPLVEPPPGAGPHRAAMVAPSGIRAEPLDSSRDPATAVGTPIGRLGLDDLAELTADQLVSQSFIAEVGASPRPSISLLEDEASAVGELAFDEPAAARDPAFGAVSSRVFDEVSQPAFDDATAAGVGRAPLDRQSTEVAGSLSGGGLAASLPALVIGGGGADETMQISARLLRPPSALLPDPLEDGAPDGFDDALADGLDDALAGVIGAAEDGFGGDGFGGEALEPPEPLTDDGTRSRSDVPVFPAALDDEDRAGRTALGMLAQVDDPAPPPPPSPRPATGARRIRRSRP